MDFQSLQNDLKDWLKRQAQNAASAARAVDSKVQGVENYLGIKRSTPPPNPIKNPKAFAKDILVNKPVQSVKNIINPVIEGINIISSYPLGGAIKANAEKRAGTYKAPEIKILGKNIGEYVPETAVGIVRGVRNKQTLFDEVPKALNIKNPAGAAVVGLASELAVPVPGPGKIKKIAQGGKTVIQSTKEIKAGEKILARGKQLIEQAAPKVKEILTDAGAEIKNAKLYQKNLIEEAAQRLKALEESFTGGQTVSRVPGEEGYESYGGSMNLKRISEHSREYREYFKKFGKKPPLAFYRDLIQKQIKTGVGEVAEEYHAIEDWIKSFGETAQTEMVNAKDLIKRVKDKFDPEKISDVLENTLKKNPSEMFKKPGRLEGEGYSFKEAMTGLAENGQDIAGRIRVALDDAKNLLIDDGTHLLEAYRQLKIPVPTRKISFASDEAKELFEKAIQGTKDAINPKTLRARFTMAINKSKTQEEAADNISSLVDRIMTQGNKELIDEAKKAINSQLARFQDFRGNPKAGTFFKALENGFEKLSDVPFGAEGMFKRTDADLMKKDFENFYFMKKETDAPRVISNPTVANMSEALTDLNPMRAAFSDLYRNFKKVFGENFQIAKEQVLDPFDAAKAKFVEDQKNLLQQLKENVVDGLGIEKGSELSRYVQQFGEKKLPLGELQQMLPKDWERVVKADQWFRGMYDNLLDQVNEIRAKIYPNNPEKIIPKRNDYYRHFQEMAEGFAGLKNIFETPSAIQSPLAGVSEVTKPKSRWASFMQKRTGDQSKLDAVGGFIDYIKASMYAKNIDPMIEGFRGLAEDLRTVTANEGGRLNNFIVYLDDFANDLSGKTNKLDRAIQDWIPGNRKTMKALDWLNNRFKVNAIVGNISSAVNQTLALPASVADAGVANSIKAIPNTLTNIFKETDSLQSNFLKERYLSSAYDAFDKGMVANTKKAASWLLRTIEETTTRHVWNSEYQKALEQGVPDAVKQADEWTRAIVAGRGVGEVPLAQKSRIFQMALPFQLEIANTWMVFKDWMDAKTFGKLITFAVASNMLNSAIQGVSGYRPGFDPLAALSEGLQGSLEGKEGGTGLYPLAGEVLSNIPGGGYLTRALLSPDDSQKIFGEKNDPTRFDRFGTGIPLASAMKPVGNVIGGFLSGDGVKASDVAQIVEYFGLPFGGGQVKKTLGGMNMLATGGRYDSKGGLQFPTDQDFTDKLGALFYGPYANDNARIFFDQNLSALTEKETAAWKEGVKAGKNPVEFWLEIQKGKISRGLKDRTRDVMREKNMTLEEKMEKVDQMRKEYNMLMERLTNFK